MKKNNLSKEIVLHYKLQTITLGDSLLRTPTLRGIGGLLFALF